MEYETNDYRYDSDNSDDLNDNWIKDFEEEDTPYIDFYKEEVDNIKIYVIYVNKKNKIFHIKKDNLIVEDKTIPKETLIKMIKHFLYYNKTKYNPLSILKYNIDLEPDNVIKYIDSCNNLNDKKIAPGEILEKDPNKNFNFLNEIKSIKDIYWEDTISMFKNLNALYFIFYEKVPTKKMNLTKKIKINHKKNKKFTRRARITMDSDSDPETEPDTEHDTNLMLT